MSKEVTLVERFIAIQVLIHGFHKTFHVREMWDEPCTWDVQ